MTRRRRKRTSAPTDITAVIDTRGLTESYKRKVTAALPRGVNPTEAFWRDLEGAITVFDNLRQGLVLNPPKREREHWRRIDKLTDALAGEVRAIRPRVLWSHDDPSWPNRALRALWEIKHRAEESRLDYGLVAAGFSGRRNPQPCLSAIGATNIGMQRGDFV